MAIRYVCNECGHKFTEQDRVWPVCSKCQSEDCDEDLSPTRVQAIVRAAEDLVRDEADAQAVLNGTVVNVKRVCYNALVEAVNMKRDYQ